MSEDRPKYEYARTTTVPVERTKLSIEKLLQKFGATGFGMAWEQGQEALWFSMHGWHIRFVFQPIQRDGYLLDGAGRKRPHSAVENAVAQAQRSRWRELELLIKAKLVAISSGIRTFEDEFISDAVMTNNQRVVEWLVPHLRTAYARNGMPPLLPGTRGGKEIED